MTDWNPLIEELAIWRSEQRVLPFWWRDDDAVTVTRSLRRLTDMSTSYGLPVHIAVIPANTEPPLADFLQDQKDVLPLVHGWVHKNHAPPDQKKAEFGPHRPISTLETDAEMGLSRLRDLFGARAQPVFVPPWNRVDPDLLPRLRPLGFKAVSTYLPRQSPLAAPDLLRVNTHVDPIDWRGGRSLVDPDELIARITRLLQDRRAGHSDAAEPLGLLSHHLVHDAAIWSFCAKLIDLLMSGPATIWRSDEEIK